MQLLLAATFLLSATNSHLAALFGYEPDISSVKAPATKNPDLSFLTLFLSIQLPQFDHPKGCPCLHSKIPCLLS